MEESKGLKKVLQDHCKSGSHISLLMDEVKKLEENLLKEQRLK